MAIQVRAMTAQDQYMWLDMYKKLFPRDVDAGMRNEINRILSDPNAQGFVAMDGDAHVGFAEYAIRPHANGCRSNPVPFVEGIWVDPAHRGKGIARILMDHMEKISQDAGYTEIGSDVLLENSDGQAVHARLGFEQTETVIHYRKDL